MSEESQKEQRRLEAEQKEQQRLKDEAAERRALEQSHDGEVVLIREAVDARKNRCPAGTKLTESDEWPAHRIQFMLQEGHAKMKGAEVKTGDAKEGLAAGQARRLGGKR